METSAVLGIVMDVGEYYDQCCVFYCQEYKRAPKTSAVLSIVMNVREYRRSELCLVLS